MASKLFVLLALMLVLAIPLSTALAYSYGYEDDDDGKGKPSLSVSLDTACDGNVVTRDERRRPGIQRQGDGHERP